MSKKTQLTQFDQVRTWLYEKAWPFWGSAGVDLIDGGFVEQLTLEGLDEGLAYKRVRAQSRQVYCFSQAAVLGFEGADLLAEHGWSFLTQHGRRPDGGWIRRIGRAGGSHDATSDAYDIAFVLLAHAWRYRSTKDPAVIESALATVHVLNRDLRHPNGLGWLAASDDNGPRQQNPHMHILEAAIELADATGHPTFYALAQEVVTLFCERILDREKGVLREFYDADWSTFSGPVGDIVEPGHHFEWVWILFRCQKILRQPLRAEAMLLYDFAERNGIDRDTGLVYDQLNSKGFPLSRDSRSWPQTEALKAHLAVLEFEGVDTRIQIRKIVENIFIHYLAIEPEGCWMDHRRYDGTAKAEKIPPTSLYHFQLAFTEFLRLRTLIEEPRDPPRLWGI